MILEPAVFSHAGLTQKGIAFGGEVGLEFPGIFVVFDPVIANVGREVMLGVSKAR